MLFLLSGICVQPDSQSGGFDAWITARSRMRLCASWQLVIYWNSASTASGWLRLSA